jgi:hypothetical protein
VTSPEIHVYLLLSLTQRKMGEFLPGSLEVGVG